MPTPEWAVVDSNILIAANGKSDQADDACVESCIDLLLDVRTRTRLALDADGEILAEYANKSSPTGRPGVGDEFLRWAIDNQYIHCHRTQLTRNEIREFHEFPDDDALSRFDRSDRKFVATALACTPPATIHNAVDSDWSQFAAPLASAGIKVTELCPNCLKTA
jgi:hypothetical protein